MRRPILHIYHDLAGQYRWRLRSPNGRTIADSGEGYTRERDALRAARTARYSLLIARTEYRGR